MKLFVCLKRFSIQKNMERYVQQTGNKAFRQLKQRLRAFLTTYRSLMENNSILDKKTVSYPNRIPEAVLFDWDNTLVDTWQVCFDSFNIALQAIGRTPITPEEFWNQPHLSARDSHHRFGDGHAEWERIFYDNIHKCHLEGLSAFEGAETLLKKLKGREICVGVVSNKRGVILRKEVAHLGWGDYFHAVIGSQDAEQDKPSHLP